MAFDTPSGLSYADLLRALAPAYTPTGTRPMQLALSQQPQEPDKDQDLKRKLDIIRAQRSVMDPKIMNLPVPGK